MHELFDVIFFLLFTNRHISSTNLFQVHNDLGYKRLFLVKAENIHTLVDEAIQSKSIFSKFWWARELALYVALYLVPKNMCVENTHIFYILFKYINRSVHLHPELKNITLFLTI